MNYSTRTRRQALAVVPELICCREAALAGLFVRDSASGTFCRVSSRMLARARLLVRNIKSDSVRMKTSSGRILVKGLGLKLLRSRLEQRFAIRSGFKASKHCHVSFLRAVFARSGYIQDPQRAYHLEIRLGSKWQARMLRHALKSLRIPFRFSLKPGLLVAYLKSRDRIMEFLKAVCLFDAALEFSDFAATRDIVGMVNRQVNFETANLNKTVSAAGRNIEQIRWLLENTERDMWPRALFEIARIRIDFPHDSLEALGGRLEPPLSKSAVNHRLRRLSELYNRETGRLE